MKSEFAKGCEFLETEVREYIDKNKEKLEVYDIAKAGHRDREVIDVEKFIKFLDNL